jgi:hypothetical protein
LPGGDAEWGEDFGEAFFEAGGEVLEFDDHWGGLGITLCPRSRWRIGNGLWGRVGRSWFRGP